MKAPKIYRNTAYFPDRESANAIRSSLHNRGETTARVLEFGRGFAIQYRISGPYYPECEFGYIRTKP